MPANPLPRPTLLPGLVRLWRDQHTLQLGVDPRQAILLEVTDPRSIRLLDLLDGAHSERAVLDQAARMRVTRADARALIDTLHAAGLVVGRRALLPTGLPESTRRRLVGEAAVLARQRPTPTTTPAQVLRRRRAARVVVTGAGRLCGPVALALAQAGIGHVHPAVRGEVTEDDLVGTGLTLADLRRCRATAVAEAIARSTPDTRTGPIRRGHATLVVHCGTDQPLDLLTAAHAQRRQAHLFIDLRDGVPVVGPLVRPGAPCGNCLDLHRRDRDPGWPGLAAQLVGEPGPQPCAAATLLSAAAYSTAEIVTFIDGGVPETLGAAVEIVRPGRLRRRAWPPHPSCRCGGRHRAGSAASGRRPTAPGSGRSQ